MVDLAQDQHCAVLILPRKVADVCVPTKAQIECEPRRDLPIVLNVKRNLVDLLLVRSCTVRILDLVNQSRSVKSIRQGGYLLRILGESNRVALYAKEEETVQLSINIIRTKFH